MHWCEWGSVAVVGCHKTGLVTKYLVCFFFRLLLNLSLHTYFPNTPPLETTTYSAFHFFLPWACIQQARVVLTYTVFISKHPKHPSVQTWHKASPDVLVVWEGPEALLVFRPVFKTSLGRRRWLDGHHCPTTSVGITHAHRWCGWKKIQKWHNATHNSDDLLKGRCRTGRTSPRLNFQNKINLKVPATNKYFSYVFRVFSFIATIVWFSYDMLETF